MITCLLSWSMATTSRLRTTEEIPWPGATTGRPGRGSSAYRPVSLDRQVDTASGLKKLKKFLGDLGSEAAATDENAARRQLARVAVMTGMDLDDVGWQPGCPRRDERFLERTGCEDDRAARQRLAARSYDPASA
jgi:hypothetical protein